MRLVSNSSWVVKIDGIRIILNQKELWARMSCYLVLPDDSTWCLLLNSGAIWLANTFDMVPQCVNKVPIKKLQPLWCLSVNFMGCTRCREKVWLIKVDKVLKVDKLFLYHICHNSLFNYTRGARLCLLFSSIPINTVFFKESCWFEIGLRNN